MVRQRQLNRFLARAVAFLLLFAVAGLRIIAKTNSGLPSSNPAHYISAATKMEQTQPPVISERPPLRIVSSLAPQTEMAQENRRDGTDFSPPNQLTLTSSTQHRSPPVIR